jgi:hypothetical protein
VPEKSPIVEQLPGTERSPKTLLHQVMESVDEIAQLAVIIVWNDEKAHTQVCTSSMDNASLAWMENVFLDARQEKE